MKYWERKIPRSCKRMWNTGSLFDLVFERSKDIKSVKREKSNSNNWEIFDKNQIHTLNKVTDIVLELTVPLFLINSVRFSQ